MRELLGVHAHRLGGIDRTPGAADARHNRSDARDQDLGAERPGQLGGALERAPRRVGVVKADDDLVHTSEVPSATVMTAGAASPSNPSPGPGVVGVASRKWTGSPSWTMRRNTNSSTEATSTPTPIPKSVQLP